MTGGNSGIGYVTCRELVRKNAHVFLLGRNVERCTTAIEKIKQERKPKYRIFTIGSTKLKIC